MKRFHLYISALALLLLAGSCAVTDFDRSVNFSSYQTFDWGKSIADVDNPVYKSSLIAKNIRHTIEQEFAKRGIVQDKDNPDFLVSIRTHTEEKQETHRGYYGYGYPYYFPWRFYPYFFYGWGLPYPGGVPETESYTEGTLIIDITDNKTNELVWRGSVTGKVDNISALEKQIQKGIKAIMKKYPVSPGQPLLNNQEAVS